VLIAFSIYIFWFPHFRTFVIFILLLSYFFISFLLTFYRGYGTGPGFFFYFILFLSFFYELSFVGGVFFLLLSFISIFLI